MEDFKMETYDFQYQLKHVEDDKRAFISGVCLMLGIVMTIAVALRLCCRAMMKLTLGADDYATLIGMVGYHYLGEALVVG